MKATLTSNLTTMCTQICYKQLKSTLITTLLEGYLQITCNLKKHNISLIENDFDVLVIFFNNTNTYA